MRKIKLGVLMDRLSCSSDIFRTVNSLAASSAVELHLLLNTEHRKRGLPKVVEKIRNVGLARFVSIAFFNIVEFLEARIFCRLSPGLRDYFQAGALDQQLFASVTVLTPIFSKRKLLVSYAEQDIAALRALGLDLILRANGTGIYQGNILSASRDGIISFHHGDNRWNRGGPPGFWEVYLRKAATGFVIQILNDKLDAGRVIFRGEAPTKRTYTQNMVNLYQVANPFMAKIICDYAETGQLPVAEVSRPFTHQILKTPKFTVTLNYIWRTIVALLVLALKRKVFGLHQRWSVAYLRADWRSANLSKALVIKNPPGRFLADPFVVQGAKEAVIFVEDYSYSNARGTISAVVVAPDKSYRILPDVVKEPFHLSFPFVFKYAGQLYMVPESFEANSIRLYKCIEFPARWEYQYDLMTGVRAVDSLICENGGHWWMLCNLASEGSNEFGSALYAFSADSPVSRNWRPHARNPISFSVSHGRNAGLLRGKGGENYRVRQRHDIGQYGRAASIAKITRLDGDCFTEEDYAVLEAQFDDGLLGMHHMHADGRNLVFDFVKEESLR